MSYYSDAQMKTIKRIRSNEKNGELTPAESIHKSTLRALVKDGILEVTNENVFSTDYGKFEAEFWWGVDMDDLKES